MAYSFEQIFAADPATPERVASNGVITIFAPGDASKTPLPLTTVDGMALSNPIKVNDAGFGPAFMAPIDRVGWEGGGYSGFFTSYDGLKQEAVAARTAAEKAAAEVQKPTDQAVDDGIARADIPGTVARTVAAQPTVVAAAAASVDANPKIAELQSTAVFNGDPRLIESGDAPIAFGVLDADGRRTWLEAGLDGRPTPWALQLIGEAGKAPSTQPLPGEDWAHWGDSLTDERVLGSEGWVSKLAALTGKKHYNGGWYGQKAGEIAARQGGAPAVVTLPGNTIPASGSVTVSSIRNSPVEVHATLRIEGTLAGVPGYMQEPTTNVTTFTRTTPGLPVPCPPGTRFIPTEGQALRDRTVTIWAGRNDVFTTSPRLVVASIKAQIDFLSPSVKRALVFEVLPSTTSAADHPQVLALNAAIRAAFPVEWVPVATWLRTDEAATKAGITFTSDDRADIAAGITPRSFRSDGTHLNGVGCTAVANYVYTEAQERGWLS